MNEIIVGIDFSKSSVVAFQYALEMAKVCECSLKLVYVSKARDKDHELVKDDKGMETNIHESFKKLITDCRKTVDVEISYKLLSGKIYEEITNQAKYTEADMIVVGAHGMSGYEKLWVGNNAMKIIYHSVKPVISVRKGFRTEHPVIEKIVIPIDATPQTLYKLDFTIHLASIFKAQLNILSLYNNKNTESIQLVDENTAKAMEKIIPTGLRYINESKKCENFAEATIDYASKRHGDLIAIMTHQEYSGGHSLSATFAEELINKSPLPVLSFKA